MHDALCIQTVALRYIGWRERPLAMSSRKLCLTWHPAQSVRGIFAGGQQDFVGPYARSVTRAPGNGIPGHVSLELWPCMLLEVVPRGLEPRTLRLLAERSDQLSYETL